MWLGKWYKFNKAGQRWLVSWIKWKHLLVWKFKLLLEQKDLGCSSGSWRFLGNCFYTNRENLNNCWKIK
jgi:hypothetical protein